MRILFVAMPESIHAARWIRNLEGAEHEIILFSPYISNPHRMLHPVRRYTPLLRRVARDRINWCTLLPVRGAWLLEAVLQKLWPRFRWRRWWLEWVIRWARPDLVHSMEFQQAGYLCLESKKRLRDKFPTWLATNYGSDIYLFGRLSAHIDRVRDILRTADFYSAESERDIRLARQHGLTARPLPILLDGGGIDLSQAAALRAPGPTSSRRTIAVKGYQNFAGRALTALRGIELAADTLRKFDIRVYAAHESVEIEAELIAQRTGLDIKCVPYSDNHADMLRLHGQARISLGIGISDGVPASFLESLVMGSFPIQSSTASADEWIEDGRSGFLVPPDDPRIIADRLIQAATDDALVDQASDINWRTAEQRLDRDIIQRQILDGYATIAGSIAGRRA